MYSNKAGQLIQSQKGGIVVQLINWYQLVAAKANWCLNGSMSPQKEFLLNNCVVVAAL